MGTMAGALLADVLHSVVLQIVFGIFLLAIGLRFLLPHQVQSEHTLPNRFWMNVVGFSIGGKSGLLGVGGGALSIPFFTYCNVPMRNTVGITSACSFTVALIGGVSFMITGANESYLPVWSVGYVYWPAVLFVAFPSMLFAHVGAWLSYYVSVKRLQKIFAVLLLVVGTHMLLKGLM